MTTPLVLPTPLDRPVHPSWGWGVWLAISIGVIVEAVAAFAVMALTVFSASTTCGQPATDSNMWAGEKALLVAACIGLAPWALAMIFSRRRLLIPTLGLVSVAPLVFAMFGGLDPQFWVGSFCF
jgi:hypothetical protein